MEITGKLKVKNEAVHVSDKFRKREFVITDDSSQYPQHILFQLTQDKCSLLDNSNIGDEIRVHFNLRGRLWVNPQGEDKYFNSLDAWRIETINKFSEQPSSGPDDFIQDIAPNDRPTVQPIDPMVNDLPF